jgi:hypothetical protein
VVRHGSTLLICNRQTRHILHNTRKRTKKMPLLLQSRKNKQKKSLGHNPEFFLLLVYRGYYSMILSNISFLSHTFHLPNIASTATKNQQITQKKEEKYYRIHLPQNLQCNNDVYTHSHCPLIQTDCLYK